MQNLSQAKRLVVKVGTSTLTHPDGQLNLSRIDSIVRQVVDLKQEGMELILVSSGAVAAGRGRMKPANSPVKLGEKQALAAVGQGILLHIYEKLFMEYGHSVGQVLLTRSDLEDRNRTKNVVRTLSTLVSWGVVPVINENDTTAVDEIKVGDNDILAAMVAVSFGADLMVILTDVDGLLRNAWETGSEVIRTVSAGDHAVKELVEESLGRGTGGMATKLLAGDYVAKRGIPLIIANGGKPRVLRDVLERKTGTTILPKGVGA